MDHSKGGSSAAGSEISGQIISAVDEGFAALWAIYSRPAVDGSLWAEVDELPNLGAYTEYCRGKPEIALAGFEILLRPDDDTDMSAVERAAIERAAAIFRAALLKHVPT